MRMLKRYCLVIAGVLILGSIYFIVTGTLAPWWVGGVCGFACAVTLDIWAHRLPSP